MQIQKLKSVVHIGKMGRTYVSLQSGEIPRMCGETGGRQVLHVDSLQRSQTHIRREPSWTESSHPRVPFPVGNTSRYLSLPEVEIPRASEKLCTKCFS
jgi:hypothetical protein